MHLEIITPEHVIFNAEVDAVTLPGKDGEFQLLNNHAPIVATLGKGTIKIKVHSQTFEKFNDESGKIYTAPAHSQTLLFDIKGGTIEMNNNKILVLAN
ncbi:F0F1 ATP synthase subunit epsilon [Chishuiella sp.]|uniref:FoF1 ATP synthase subunit delta/epsilon n=1 Tax=Chishuiella sp. TaxID=1969467 RepID=UPI0028AE9ECD|nr:F0F1 ATP synthase subunit epsilon [Chishuiella sp.]